eukprot:TRINITY_DN9746_c0_g2_i1.p1 TRINITY_DN9746_c0_g2~~TRINITY_DN9746_c0_g2_i1.p1  ORF type:complete len:313 (-),score=-92.81 TRINITY_DN9746_c0_g2_i1:138-1076(-)
MANLHYLFTQFNEELKITKSKKDNLMTSKENLRKRIRDYFFKNHPTYKPRFYIQGSYKLKLIIRTKDDTCDLDDGVYFEENPDNVTSTTLQGWVKNAVEGTTDSKVEHRKKCITVDYKAGYNIDLPVLVFNSEVDDHPNLAVKNLGFQEDDPKEFVEKFNTVKSEQMVRIIKYLKAWCDHKRENMPSGLSMTVLTMDNYVPNTRDDVALKFLLIEIENVLKRSFKCVMPTTPKDDLFKNFSEVKKKNFMDNLSKFIKDAKDAIEEKNKKTASLLWKKHLGDRFPEGKDEDEVIEDSARLVSTIGASKPYFKL